MYLLVNNHVILTLMTCSNACQWFPDNGFLFNANASINLGTCIGPAVVSFIIIWLSSHKVWTFLARTIFQFNRSFITEIVDTCFLINWWSCKLIAIWTCTILINSLPFIALGFYAKQTFIVRWWWYFEYGALDTWTIFCMSESVSWHITNSRTFFRIYTNRLLVLILREDHERWAVVTLVVGA